MDERLSTTRLYGSAIAIVSGVYSLWLATTGASMTGSAWLMVVLGIVVLLHGVVLVTPAATSLSGASGPLMIAYAVVMLLNQVWMLTTGGRRTNDGMDGGMGGMDGSMGGMDGWMSGMDGVMGGADAGMVAIAVLMLVSGVLMTLRDDDMSRHSGMSRDDADSM